MFIRLAGRLMVSGPSGVVEATGLPGRQGRLVLTLLALTGQPVSRQLLADRLWGERLPKAWERDLSAVVSKVRAAFGRAGAGEIVSDAVSYQLRLPPDARVDIPQARLSTEAAERALADGRADLAADLAGEVIEVAARPFLPGEDDGWVDEVRAELRQLRLRALEVSAEVYAGSGQFPAAVRALSEVLDLEPYRETAGRRLMRVHLEAGNRAEAVRTYERMRERLAGELGVDPAPGTAQLYLEVLRATLVAPVGSASLAVPDVLYARSGRLSIAYQVLGDGPVDLVLVPGWVSNVELCWQEPRMAAFLRRIATSSRLMLFDKRGTGLSDPIPVDAPPLLEERMDDVRAVMDAAGSERAVVMGFSEGGAMSAMFAAAHPERTAGLVLWGTWCRQLRDQDFPLGWTREQGMRRFVRPIQQRGVVAPQWFVPSLAGDPAFLAWFERYARQSASPGMAIALLKANAAMDVRAVLPSVRVPTMVLHRIDDVLVEVGQGRYLAEHIPGARMVEFPGSDHWPWVGDSEPILAEIVAFLDTVATPVTRREQVLATVVAASLAEPMAAAVTGAISLQRGVVIERTAEMVTARFDGPGRAVDCAVQLVGMDTGRARAGVHTGEVTFDGDRVHGLTVEIAGEVAARAAAGEVLVTRTVTDLVAGSRLRFDPRGEQDLPKVGAWTLFAVA
jgi:pimeloyl-ACP methyl ester carboxylesterase/DNA-binding SARP family transcriptional activator